MFKKLLIIYFEFLKIGLFTIGGGLAMIPLIQKTVVEDKKWLTEEDMLDCIALSQAVPGIIAVSCGTYVGKRLYGFKGSVAATLGVITPSFFIIISMVFVLDALKDIKYVKGALLGIKAAVTGTIMVTVYKLGKQILHDSFSWTVAAISFIMVAVIQITAVWAVLFGAASGLAAVLISKRLNS